MSDYILIPLDNLYKLYSIKDIFYEYFNFNFLPNYESIDIDTIYDIFNCLDLNQLHNFINYLFKEWSKIKLNDEINTLPTAKRRNYILSKQISPDKIKSKLEFNNIIKSFINEDKILGLFFINKSLLFLYPHI